MTSKSLYAGDTVDIVDVTFEGRPYSFRTHGPQDHIARVMRSTGRFYEEDLLRAIRDLDRRGVYVDVGAHIGNHTVFFAAECPSTCVEAYEASRWAYLLLRPNIRQIERVRAPGSVFVCGSAISDSFGQCQLECPDPANSGMNRIVPGTGSYPMLTLDAQLPDEPIAVIKIDVEGHELAVLKGGVNIIEAHHPVIAVEMNDPAVRDFLSARGYKHHGTYCATPTEIWV